MSDPNDVDARRTFDETAALLGRVAQGLEGAVSRAEDLAARERLLASLSERRPRGAARWWPAAALVGALATLVVVFFRPRATNLEYSVVGPATARGEWLAVPADRGAVALRFSEGTEIELGPSSQGRVADVTADGARVVLAGGTLHARVVHRPSTRWTVAAGPYDIEVTGTAFDVRWSTPGQRLELSLHDGSVIVHGPQLQGGIRVAAGQRLVANATTGGAELSSLFQPPASDAPAVPEPSATTPAPASSATAIAPDAAPAGASERPPPEAAPSWSELVSLGNFRAVLDAANARGVEQTLSHGSLRDLAALADAARYGGDRALARRGLLAQRTRFATSSEAHTAAFVLGRMADDAGSMSEALGWYEGYLREAPRGAFAAEASGRRLVALVRLRNTRAAHDAAGAYLKQYPRGAHAAYAREVLQRP